MQQLPRQPRPAEIDLVLYSHVGRINLDPLGLELRFLIEKMQLLIGGFRLAFGRLLDAASLGLLELS